MLMSQRSPVKPFEQLQMKEPGVFTHLPLCSHGERKPESNQHSHTIKREHFCEIRE
jgi:hypothetical protein